MEHDPYETCPYDKVHRVLKSRLPLHLTKCRVQYAHLGLKECPYDARHAMPEEHFRQHVETCPARENVLHHVIVTEDPIQNLILPIESFPIVGGENWDEEVEVKTYDPIKNTEDKPVLRQLIGGSKKERKKRREIERQRVAQLENDKERQEKREQEAARQAAKIKKQTKVVDTITTPEPGGQEYKPLRRPKNPPADLNASLQINKSITEDFKNLSLNTSVKNNNASLNLSLQRQNIEAPSNSTLPCKDKVFPPGLIPQSTKVHTPLRRPMSLPPKQSQSLSSVLSSSINDTSIQSRQSESKENFYDNSFVSEKCDMLSQTIDELELEDEEHKRQEEILNERLASLGLQNEWIKVGGKNNRKN